MRLDFSAIEERMKEFLEYFKPEDKPMNNLYVNLSRENPEEGLFYLLLETHFDPQKSAEEFFKRINWKYLKNSNKANLTHVCEEFFRGKISIGDHRRYFRCLKKKKKINYTIEMLESYKEVILKYGSQSQFFKINGKPDFNTLYEKMKQIKHFETRLPRWDHLEKLSRTHSFYIIPKRFYAEDSTGPLDGLILLFFGERLRKMSRDRKSRFKKYLKDDFPENWNSKVEDKYKIENPQGLENWKDVIPSLEKWAIDKIYERLPMDKRTSAFIFDLESCLCNWQKRKKRPCS